MTVVIPPSVMHDTYNVWSWSTGSPKPTLSANPTFT